ncbi:MAG: hypothetical protein ACU0CA_00740 [Paracoccaceae bacterium]
MGKRVRMGVAAALACVIVSQLPASAGNKPYSTRNGMRVVAGATSDPGRFDILQKSGSGGSEYWCGAGHYAMERLQVPPATRIYLVQALGPGPLGRNSIGFSVTPGAASGGGGVTMSMKKVGQNWGAEHARSQCDTSRRR